jgi:hypothetical protein
MARFDDKKVRMKKFDKKHLPIGKEFLLLQPENRVPNSKGLK